MSEIKIGDHILFFEECYWSNYSVHILPGDRFTISSVGTIRRGAIGTLPVLTINVNESSRKHILLQPHNDVAPPTFSLHLNLVRPDGTTIIMMIGARYFKIIKGDDEPKAEVAPTKAQCICSNYDLFNFGCRCGAFKK